MSDFAHFENVPESRLTDIYLRHGEVAREIHQDTLRNFTNNSGLTVDLVRENAVGADQAVLDKMSQYDVISVSTETGMGSILRNSGLSDKENIDMYRQQFEQVDMPIYVVSSGNNGESKRTEQPRLADFSRTSLVVGEANMGNGTPYIEAHSSKNNPTIASDTPFNRGSAYQYYDVNPSLEGHEKLIQDWIVDNEFSKRFDEFKVGDGKDLDDRALGKAYWDIKDDLNTEKFAESRDVQAQVKNFMANPQELHSLVMSEIREHREVDKNGYTSDIDGTSFAAPEQAGYVSGAMYEQKQREENNLPILMKEEISTLVKLATIDIDHREGQDSLMHIYNNSANFEFSPTGAGHGVFNPEMFRALLDESYVKIQNNQDINRDPVTVVMEAKIDTLNKNGGNTITLNSSLPESSSVVIERSRIDLDFSVNGSVPHYIAIDRPEMHEQASRIQQASSGREMTGWARKETDFGETINAGDNWEFRIHNAQDSTLQDVRVTSYGYNEGGLMDQMMDHSKQITHEFAPQQPAPAAETVPVTPIENSNNTTAPLSM